MASNKQSSSAHNNSPIRTPVENAILTTLAYSSLFSSPMSKEELWIYLISSEKVDKALFQRSLQKLCNDITIREEYVALKGHEQDIEKRIQYVSEVAKKYAIAQKVAAILRRIDSIEFLGISGGLAAKNVTAEEDIDLFIIVRKNTIFITRFWILLMLALLGLRRKRNQRNVANKICVNLLIDTTSMQWQKRRQDVYTAREIAQVQPLYEKKGMYDAFLEKNRWVTSFLPNAFSAKKSPVLAYIPSNTLTQNMHFILTSGVCEILMRLLQKSIISRHKTNEIVTNQQLAFHPKDYRVETLRRLKLKMRQLGLLTKI